MFAFYLLLLATVLAQPQLENDIHYCGSYESDCIHHKSLSHKQTAILSGKPFEEPVMLGLISNNYQEGACSDDKFLMNTAIIGSIQSEGMVEKTYDVMINDVFLVASEIFINQLTCETPIEPMTQYKVQDVHCVDKSGKDPWAASKAIVGHLLPYNMTFTDNTLVIQHDEHSTSFKRISEEGCSAPTVTPTTLPPEPDSNKLWMWLWIGSGIIMVLVVLIVVAQQCKNKKEKKEYIENKPLV